MTTASASPFRAIALDQLKISPTSTQAERRRHFDKTALTELADSVKSIGVLEPILARPVNGHFEIVFGERRYLAAKKAGLADIPTNVRDLNDEQVLEIQLIENLQREGLHELVEAEGYEELHKFGHSAEDIADKVGKSKAYVYARMKLLALGPETRAAFRDGKLSASVALFIARIPIEALQKKALKEVIEPRYGYGRDPEPMSVREAQSFIQREYMLQLAGAPFDVTAENLVPGALPCGRCPKNTLAQPELFGDVTAKGNAGVCTDPGCFKSKREASAKLAIVKAREKGITVLTGKAAAEIMTDSGFVKHGYSKPNERCYTDPKHRTFAQILGAEAKPVTVQNPDTGELVKVIKTDAATRKLKADGVIKPAAHGPSDGAGAVRARKIDQLYRRKLFEAIVQKTPSKPDRHLLEAIALVIFESGYDDDSAVYQALGWEFDDEKKRGTMDDKAFLKRIREESDAGLMKVIVGLLFREELDEYGSPKALEGEAKRLGLNAPKIKVDAKKEYDLAAPKPKGAAKKKAKASKKGK